MKVATQDELTNFFNKALLNENIYPYLSLTKYQKPLKVSEDNWNDIWLCTDNCQCFFHMIFDRLRDEITIGLWAENSESAGNGMNGIREYIKRYKPRAINSVVHASNKKSIELHNRIYGTNWGLEPKSAWNSKLGDYEDAMYFRKLL